MNVNNPPTSSAPMKIDSPCTNVCKLDPRSQLCIGCMRSGEEIMRWRELSTAERRHYMDVVLPARAQRTQP